MDPAAETQFALADRTIGGGEPLYIIAEMSANHLGDFDRALAIVHAAADAGADAIKLQTYSPETMTLDSDLPAFRIGAGTPWADRTLIEVYREAMTPWDWTPKLMAVARERGLHCFSSPFDPSAVAFLETHAVPAYKIASFELVDLALIECAARTGKPVIMSTGMATLDEIEDAVAAARRGGASGIALLKCTSAYPAPPEVANLRALATLREHFGVPVGLSDHTLDTTVVVAAVALGACVIEKHLTLARADGGPDGDFSLEPDEFAAMVVAARTAQRALGDGRLAMQDAERATSQFRRSLWFVEDLAPGALLTADNVRALRPGDGLAPKHLSALLGRRAAGPIARGTPVQWDLLHPKDA